MPRCALLVGASPKPPANRICSRKSRLPIIGQTHGIWLTAR